MSPADAIHLEVGRALTAWEGLQADIQLLYHALCMTNSAATLASFSLVESVPTRTQMVKLAAKYALDKNAALQDQLNALMNKVRDLSDHRNQIAHGCMTCIVENGTKNYFLMPPEVAGKRWDYTKEAEAREPYRLDAKNIEETRLAFEAMHRKSSCLRSRIYEALNA